MTQDLWGRTHNPLYLKSRVVYQVFGLKVFNYPHFHLYLLAFTSAQEHCH